MQNINSLEIVIKKELLNKFCQFNDFIIVTDNMLKEQQMYKNFVYATNDNFVGKRIYPKDMPVIINKIVWNKLIKVNDELKEYGLSLMIYDAYRPIEIQKIFWEYFYHKYGFYNTTLVANPNKYGTHNIKVNAVDILVVDSFGNKVELPCEFDDFTGKANIYYNECSEKAKYNRDLLINICRKNGLLVNDDEWWHFYDDSLEEYGMKYDYKHSHFVPLKDQEVFILKNS